MKAFLKMLAQAILTAVFLLIFVFVLVWAMDEPLYGTQQHSKPVSYKPAACNRVMT